MINTMLNVLVRLEAVIDKENHALGFCSYPYAQGGHLSLSKALSNFAQKSSCKSVKALRRLRCSQITHAPMTSTVSTPATTNRIHQYRATKVTSFSPARRLKRSVLNRLYCRMSD